MDEDVGANSGVKPSLPSKVQAFLEKLQQTKKVCMSQWTYFPLVENLRWLSAIPKLMIDLKKQIHLLKWRTLNIISIQMQNWLKINDIIAIKSTDRHFDRMIHRKISSIWYQFYLLLYNEYRSKMFKLKHLIDLAHHRVAYSPIIIIACLAINVWFFLHWRDTKRMIEAVDLLHQH